MPYAAKGSVVACPDGHPVCTVAQDILTGDPVKSSQFSDWRSGSPPKSGDPIFPPFKCPTCGKSALLERNGGFAFAKLI
jgi:hypothetical protein